jgi:hypothetical protein
LTTVLRILRALALAAWTGSLLFFVFVAQIAFTHLDLHAAGEIVRASLTSLHHLGLAAGVVYFLATVTLLGSQHDTHPARALELVLIVAMMSLTAYSQYSVIPRMERDRLALGGDVSPATVDRPEHRNFDRLHSLSVKFEGAVLLEGFLLLCLAPVHGRDDDNRFQ